MPESPRSNSFCGVKILRFSRYRQDARGDHRGTSRAVQVGAGFESQSGGWLRNGNAQSHGQACSTATVAGERPRRIADRHCRLAARNRRDRRNANGCARALAAERRPERKPVGECKSVSAPRSCSYCNVIRSGAAPGRAEADERCRLCRRRGHDRRRPGRRRSGRRYPRGCLDSRRRLLAQPAESRFVREQERGHDRDESAAVRDGCCDRLRPRAAPCVPGVAWPRHLPRREPPSW